MPKRRDEEESKDPLVLCALYFASSVFYVKLRVTTINPRKEEARRQSWKRCAFYHTFLLASLVLLAMTGKPELVCAGGILAGADSLILVSGESGPAKQSSASRLARDDLLDSVLDLHHPDLPVLTRFVLLAQSGRQPAVVAAAAMV
jgi:hypothetical protein